MKKIFVITQVIIIICVSSDCILYVPKGMRYYEGYIYTIEGQPVGGLRVYPSIDIDSAGAGGMTNEHGYFKFRQARYLVTRCLIIESEGRIIDSIERGRNLHTGEIGTFDDRTADTFFVDMEGKGRSFSVWRGRTRPIASYYEGYIYSIEGQPLRDLRVYPATPCTTYCHCIKADYEGGMTNEHGYFKFEKSRPCDVWHLVIESEGRAIDSIYRDDRRNGKYDVFVDEAADTFFVDMEGKGSGFIVLQGEKRPLMLADKRDGQKYRTVAIGKKRWMAQNLNYKTDSSWCYDNADSYCFKYGRLYSWKAAMEACPAGYHLPTRTDWDTLAAAVGGVKRYSSEDDDHDWEDAGEILKSKSGWNNTYGNSLDDFGFSALPGGNYNGGSFYNAGNNGGWWTATEFAGSFAYYRRMNYSNRDVYEYYDAKSYGRSVRCAADAP